jgi:hypothetical protein
MLSTGFVKSFLKSYLKHVAATPAQLPQPFLAGF